MIGKHRNKKLSAIHLMKLPPGMHGDGDGLYLSVQNSGSRSWVLRTSIHGERKTLGLGGLKTVSLAEAREKARELQAKARNGENVLKERRAAKQTVPLFKEAALIVHANESDAFKSNQHARNWLRSLEQYVFPIIGDMPVDAIGSADIVNVFEPIWNDVPDTARRTLRRVKKIFDYCQAKQYRDVQVENGKINLSLAHPCDGIRMLLPKQTNGSQHHEALPYRDLPDFIPDMRKCGAALTVKLAFEFLILTAARTSEVLFAKWDEIDMQDKTWSIPAERMKMKKSHKVPLSESCIEILKLSKTFTDDVYLFPSDRKPGEPLSNMAFLMCLRRMGLDELTAHGFRATFKTWAEEETDFDSLVIEASLAHEVKGIERHYLRTTFFEKRRELIAAWAVFATDL